MSTTVGKLSVELGISDDQLRAGLAAAMVQAQQAGQKISQSMNQAGKSAGNTNPQGLLNLSRAADDLQYGFRGIINNIEGIVTGFGGSAGLAGAATLAAIAIGAILPKIASLIKQTDPMRDLSNTLRDIGNTGISSTFMGMEARAKATQEAFQAAAEKLKEMQTLSQKVVFSAAGPGMAAAPAMSTEGVATAQQIQMQQRQAVRLAQDAARLSFESSREKNRVFAAGLADFDLTTSQKEMQGLNQQIFQAAIDKFGGGRNVERRLDFLQPNQGLFGAFKEGDLNATKEAVKLLGLQAEQSKVLADDYERVTGSAKELAAIEEDAQKAREESAKQQQKQAAEQAKAVEDNMKNLANIFRDRQSLMKKEDSIRGNIEELQLQRQRTEIIGSSDVFMKNFTAGTEKDPVVNAIEKQTEDLKEVIDKLKELN